MSISDTSPEAAEVQLAIFRKMTGEDRLRLALEMSDFARGLSLSRIRSEHPDWSDWAVKRELLRLQFLPEPLPAGLP
jgi:hypothetical protein